MNNRGMAIVAGMVLYLTIGLACSGVLHIVHMIYDPPIQYLAD